ncbi:helix-turn-helix domain-containing protein [Massilia sp. BSC265]|uniref:helix-turn-helix domain-containing protein n=1 Tax=Massilia sp. BSC265 TaxID=1549812 RepID=UPI0004E8E379|nr:AraC family transcriptional regulator [Massilia sp. BSC265]KFI08093.1 AraC family transcriptional regulator [Massilia sp. BSC265]
MTEVRTEVTSAEGMKEYIPGQMLRERRAQADDDIYVEIATRNAVQDEILVPAVPEPLLVWIASGEAVVEERPPGGEWLAVPVRKGDFYLTTSPIPVEMRWRSTSPAPFTVMHVYVGLPLFTRVVHAATGRALGDFALREVSGERDPLLCGVLELLYTALSAPAQASSGFIQGMAQALTYHLVEHYEVALDGRKIVRGGLPAHKLHRILDAMRGRLAEPFELAPFADMAGLSVFHFSRVFKQATGMAPSRYVARLRLEEARRLLCETERSIIDIGLALGYQSPSHFSQIFRQGVGVSPSVYRRELGITR